MGRLLAALPRPAAAVPVLKPHRAPRTWPATLAIVGLVAALAIAFVTTPLWP